MRLISHIVLHTAAAYNPKTGKVVHQTIAEIDKYHREHNGWRKVGYHWFVRDDGTGERGRQDDEVGAHVNGFNAATLGLCVSGHGDYLPWNDKQMAEVVRKCSEWCRVYRVNPIHVIGHREADDNGAPPVYKTCPGLLVDMNLVRERIADRLETSG